MVDARRVVRDGSGRDYSRPPGPYSHWPVPHAGVCCLHCQPGVGGMRHRQTDGCDACTRGEPVFVGQRQFCERCRAPPSINCGAAGHLIKTVRMWVSE